MPHDTRRRICRSLAMLRDKQLEQSLAKARQHSALRMQPGVAAEPMFKKILIANRGEIACRVITTARRMGIKTVAVYSDADADALHVRDGRRGRAHRARAGGRRAISGSTASSRPARQTGAEAVHPGYGFLSENASFARGAGRGGHRLHRSRRPRHRRDGRQDRIEEARQGGRRHHRARLSRRRSTTPTRRSDRARASAIR